MIQVKITDKNENDLRQLSQLINASSTAITNYILRQGLKTLADYFNESAPKELKEAFSEALKEAKK